MKTPLRALGPAALATLAAAPTWAQTPDPSATCDAAAPMSPTRLLRRLSLDLRGRAPTFAELSAARDAGRVPEQTVASWVRSD